MSSAAASSAVARSTAVRPLVGHGDPVRPGDRAHVDIEYTSAGITRRETREPVVIMSYDHSPGDPRLLYRCPRMGLVRCSYRGPAFRRLFTLISPSDTAD